MNLTPNPLSARREGAKHSRTALNFPSPLMERGSRGEVGSHGRYLLLALLCALAACVPARVPEHLDDTPGPPFVIADGWYRGAAFQARIPPDWRVITGEAARPPAVIFVAPEDAAVIRLSLAPLTPEAVAADGQRAEIETLALGDGQTLWTALTAPDADWARYAPVWAAVNESVGGVG